MSFKRPDVYVFEDLARQDVGSGVSASAVAALIGITKRGPADPTLIENWTQYNQLFGGFDGGSLAQGVFDYFSNGGGPAYIQRAISSSAAAATRTLTDSATTPLPTLNVSAANPGVWGNTLYLSIGVNPTGGFDLVVKFGSTATSSEVERFTGLTMDPNSQRYAPYYINQLSQYIVAADLNSATPLANRNPAAQVNSVLATGTDGVSVTTAEVISASNRLSAIDSPLVLAYPGITDASVLTDAINRAQASAKNFVVCDVPASTGTTADYLIYTATLPASDYGAVYGPWISVPDPTKTATRGTKLVPPSGSVLGAILATDVKHGPFKTAAGDSDGHIVNALDVEVKFSAAELDSLNSAAAPVNVIRPITGRGICIMGGRTLNPTTAAKYVAVRRSLIYIRQSLRDLVQYAVFAPNDETLWASLTSTCSNFLTGYRAEGGLRGGTDAQAFFVRCDATTNTQLGIQNGEVNVQIGVAVEYPAEFVIVHVGLFEGGASASESA
jgi:phage tail sheath protein FI